MKIKMLGYVENLLRKWVARSDENQPAPVVSASPAPARRPVMAPRPEGAPAYKNSTYHNGRGIELPLQPILSNLPLELQPRLKHPDAGALTLSMPLEKILAQLSRGVVKVSFGELRQAAPDLFTEENDRDSVLLPLPLGEILSRLNPALITRRRVQKQVEVPAEISSPFDPRSQGLIFSLGPTKLESAPTPAPRQVAPPAPSSVSLPSRGGITFAPTPLPPAAAPAPFDTPALSATPRRPSEPSTSQAPAPAAPASSPPQPTGNPNPLLVNLTSLAEGWPEAVRHELVQLNLVEAKVALPAEVVERALKQGRVAFTWKTLRSWIKPAPLPTVSAHDSLVLELPLKIVAPPFLARQKEAGKLQKKVVVDDEIPNLFFGFPRPESTSPVAGAAASAPPPKQADTNFYTWDDTSDRPQLQASEAKRDPSPGTKFVAKYATPNEVVSRAAALDGVAGALIALPDGLMVASRLRADLNGDTLAAFLPQIFGKVNQCTKELRMGELNNVNFTVGNIPWKIFRVNAIFFAAFGRVGEPLPTAQLVALASELDHRPK
jgi:predicted regulator of Ras-like GTPase activity (Roadblock/LC7/MglB family)